MSISEAVAHALVHGVSPVLFKAWAAPGKIIVAIHDHGPGLADLSAGLRPGSPPGGFGLWMAHQLCAYVSLRHANGGFTVRLVGGETIVD